MNSSDSTKPSGILSRIKQLWETQMNDFDSSAGEGSSRRPTASQQLSTSEPGPSMDAVEYGRLRQNVTPNNNWQLIDSPDIPATRQTSNSDNIRNTQSQDLGQGARPKLLPKPHNVAEQYRYAERQPSIHRKQNILLQNTNNAQGKKITMRRENPEAITQDENIDLACSAPLKQPHFRTDIKHETPKQVSPSSRESEKFTRKNWQKGNRSKNDGSKKPETRPGQGSPPNSEKEKHDRRPLRSVLYGEIMRIIPSANGGFGFIRANESLPDPYDKKDVHFHVDKISAGGFTIKSRDKVSFILNAKETSRPFAVSVNLIRCMPRAESEIENCLQNLYKLLKSGTSSQGEVNDCSSTIVSLLHCPAVFRCFGESKMTNNTIELLVKALLLLRSKSKSLENYLKSCLLELMKTPLMNPNNGPFKVYVKGQSHDHMALGLLKDSQRLFQFVQMIVELAPQKSRAMISLIKPMIADTPIEKLLYTLLKKTSRGSSEDPSDLEWDELPLVPSVKELMGDPSESRLCLQPVICKGPYRSAVDYMDTYFRLLRADCFGALQEGVQKLACGEEVDQRDMKVYFGIKLAGIYLPQKEGGFALGLQFIPKQKNIKWATSSNLMYGNLLCISVTGTFRDPIWATIYIRDVGVLEKTQTIFVELCTECNRLSDADVIALMTSSQGRGMMVESPTYYKAYQPVLKKLQSIDPESLPFQEELVSVHTDVSGSKYPDYIDETTQVKLSHIFKVKDMDVPFTHVGDVSRGLETTLDEFQVKAVLNMLQNRVAIVQGPPGTGKTYVGIKLLLTLLTISTLPEGPILALTYKNHALDEFLKDIIQSVGHEHVIRVGGRSQDPDLAECALSNILRNRKTEKSLFMKIRDKKDQIYNMRGKLVQSLKKLTKVRTYNHYLITKYLSPDQLFDFLNKVKDNPKLKSMQALLHGWINSFNSENPTAFVNGVKEEGFDTIAAIFKIWYSTPAVVSQVETELGLTGLRMTQVGDDKYTRKVTAEDEELFDEKDIEDMQKERASAAAASLQYKEVTKQDLYEVSGTDTSKPSLFSLAKHVTQQLPSAALLNVPSLWDLSFVDRVKLIQCILVQEAQEPAEEFQKQLTEYQQLCLEREELEMQDKIQLLSGVKVIGMTITGASIYQRILAEVKPAIVIVEEAAEILEPQLLASLGPWVQHLIMIGDHKQLRPSVETYQLVTQYHFDVSMMERLIQNRMPYKSLGKQNRMRPEISKLLLDIYPNLQDNLERVRENKPVSCITENMFFWSHTDEETSGRSYTNEEEAQRVLRLAIFLMQQGYSPESITILAAYQGQVALLRRKIRQAETSHKIIFEKYQAVSGPTHADDTERKKYSINVHTVDMYQGDENDIVIVSLVRSNSKGSVGFLRLLNRRCVAQSRSRSGLYMIGNGSLLRGKVEHWDRLIKGMEAVGCYGDQIELVCPLHSTSRYKARSGDDITLKSFCTMPCSNHVTCAAYPRHRCPNKCQPPHSHNKCFVRVPFKYEKCGHKANKECWMPIERMQCDQKCIQMMDCGLHQCSQSCAPQHNHNICIETVQFTCCKCSNQNMKLCHENSSAIKCKGVVTFIIPKCKHLTEKKCYEDGNKIKCSRPCIKLLPCKHLCRGKCGDPCVTDNCKDCEEFKKKEEEKRLELEQQMNKAAKQRVRDELDEFRKKPITDEVFITEIIPSGDTAHEYLSVEDQVKYYIQPGHKWYPIVKKIEKVYSAKLQEKWLVARQSVSDPERIDKKFHGTNEDAIKSIIREGFRMPSKAGMYGKGIYFATDSSKSAQDIYTKGSNQLLLCDIAFGKMKTVDSANQSLSSNTLALLGYDSVYAKRGTKKKGGVLYDEFVVFNPSQAIPRYIIHYVKKSIDLSDDVTVYELSLLGSGRTDFQHHNLKPSRAFKSGDPLEHEFRVAESQFLRLMNQTGKSHKIQSVDLYINPPLVAKFKIMSKSMKDKYGSSEEANQVLAFHGTKPENINGIVRRNFDLAKLAENTGDKGWFGAGIYFSEFPQTSLGYGQSLLLCKVFPGKSFDVTQRMDGATLELGYDSHRVLADKDGRGEELVIFNADQILPCYVIHYK